MNDLVRMAAGVVLIIAVAGIALVVLMPGNEPATDAPIEQALPREAPAPPVEDRPPQPVAAPVVDSPVEEGPDPAALLAQLEALTFDAEAAEDDETRAYRTLMREKTDLYRELERALKPGLVAEEPMALIQWARAQVSMGDLFNQTVLPQGLTAKQSEVYVQTAEKRARASYDEALALLDRAEAADPGLSDTVVTLRRGIQAR